MRKVYYNVEGTIFTSYNEAVKFKNGYIETNDFEEVENPFHKIPKLRTINGKKAIYIIPAVSASDWNLNSAEDNMLGLDAQECQEMLSDSNNDDAMQSVSQNNGSGDALSNEDRKSVV